LGPEVSTPFVCHPSAGGVPPKNQALYLKDEWIPAYAGTTHIKIICNIYKIYAFTKGVYNSGLGLGPTYI